MTGYNIALQSRRGKGPLTVGKVVEVDGKPVVHLTITQSHRVRNIDAYGVSEDILARAFAIGAAQIELYVKDEPATYCATPQRIRDMHIKGKDLGYGTNLNMPRRYWRRIGPSASGNNGAVPMGKGTTVAVSKRVPAEIVEVLPRADLMGREEIAPAGEHLGDQQIPLEV